MFSSHYCLRQVACLSYELFAVLIWLWEILVAFESTLRFAALSSSPLIYGLSQFLLVLFRWVLLVEQVF